MKSYNPYKYNAACDDDFNVTSSPQSLLYDIRRREVDEICNHLQIRNKRDDNSCPPHFVSACLKNCLKFGSPDEMIEVWSRIWLFTVARLLPHYKGEEQERGPSFFTNIDEEDDDFHDNKYINKWRNEMLRTLPSYSYLCSVIFNDLDKRIDDHTFYVPKRYVLPLVQIISLTVIGHMFTQTGRAAWFLVVRKFLLFLIMCCGLWTDELFDCYENRNFFDDSGESYVQMSRMLSATLSPRAIILQMVPWLTPLATYAHLTAGSPIFWFGSSCTRMKQLFAPLWYSYEDA